jgi:ABC-type transport system involved in multi-copper enzyme maturation permease subunit
LNKSNIINLFQKSAALPGSLLRIADNPIVIKELRGRMRSRRAFTVLIIYLLSISAVITILYYIIETQMSSNYNGPEFRQIAGKIIFGGVLGFELLMIGFIAPALTAGAITNERERQTLDLLRTTLISARTLVLGKLASACSYMLLLIFTALPIQALAFLLGGIGEEEIFVSILILLVNTTFFSALGILCSSFSKRTMTATITCYAIILVSVLISGIIVYMLATYIITTSLSYGGGGSSDYMLANITLWLFCSTNSILAGVVSEAFLISNQTLYYGIVPFGTNIYLYSPWVLHVGLFAVLSALLILISILRVHRVDR